MQKTFYMFKQLFILFLFTFAGLQAARTKQTYTPIHPLYGAILAEQAGVMSYKLKNILGTPIPIAGSVLLAMLQKSRASGEIAREKIVVKTDTATGKTRYIFEVQLKF